MGRYTINQGDIKISYGYDQPLNGYFLSVIDQRLKWQPDASDDVNKICESVHTSGEGVIFDLNTYAMGGFGYKVSLPVMVEFMRRYGVEAEHLEKINKDQPI